MVAEPEPVAVAKDSEPVVAEPEPVAVAEDSEPVVAEPEPVAVAVETEPAEDVADVETASVGEDA